MKSYKPPVLEIEQFYVSDVIAASDLQNKLVNPNLEVHSLDEVYWQY
jgi:hypothetical protein